MKQYYYIIITLVAILNMVGCHKTELIDDIEGAKERLIGYSPIVNKTKAPATTNLNIKEFKIATFLNDTKEHYYSDEVNLTNGVWTSDMRRYWPVGNSLDIFAYSPYSKDAVIISDATQYGDYLLSYNCPSDINQQIDLLVDSQSALTPPQNNDTNKKVELNFDHALSGVKFEIEFEGERNVTLNSINLNYINIVKQGNYNFRKKSWNPLTNNYFTTENNEHQTAIILTSDNNKTTVDATSNPIVFSAQEINNQLMIIPQPLSFDKDSTTHYVSVQIQYQIMGANGTSIDVQTGVMPLPAPKVDKDGKPITTSEYKQGDVYIYKIVVNGKKISFGDITITDQDEPLNAYGNIDLQLINKITDPHEIWGETLPDYLEGNTAPQYYYTTAQRVEKLLNDGVRDFVVVGSLGATSEHPLGNGKMGYYGAAQSAFTIGAEMAGMSAEDEENHFSVDMRGTYDHPLFKDGNDDNTNGAEKTSPTNTDIKDDDPILLAGIFKDVVRLREIILPHGVMAIGNHAFDGCIGLKSVDLSDVKHIEIQGFYECINLKEVKNGALTRVHENGFNSCYELTTIDLSRVTEVDKWSFSDCHKLTKVDLSNLEIIGSSAFDKCYELTLKQGSTSPVFHEVADFAFSECSKLGKTEPGENEIPINLTQATSIGEHAFHTCTEIKLSSGDLDLLETIGQKAFTNCMHLGSSYEVSMKKINSIGESAFQNCPKLNIINGLDRLTKIDISAFQECTSLTGYSKDETNEANKVLNLPLVTSVEYGGFKMTGLTNVAFNSQHFTKIGAFAFDMCQNLKTISGLENVTSVGEYGFSSCSALEELILPKLTNNGCNKEFFYGCSSLKVLSLPEITNNLVSSWTENGVVQTSKILDMAKASSKLETIDLPKLEGSIGGWQYFCTYMGEDANGNGIFAPNTTLKRININSITTLIDGTFKDCTALESVNLSSVLSVGGSVFANCQKLSSIELPKATSVGDAFANCTSLERLSLPMTVGTLGGWKRFSTNSSLKYIEAPLISTLNNGTFAYNSVLTTIDLRSVKAVGEMAFYACSSIRKLNLSSINTIIDGGGNVLDFNKYVASLFWEFKNGDQCEIWLPDEVAATATGDGRTWAGVTWKAIHKVSDNVPFTLE